METLQLEKISNKTTVTTSAKGLISKYNESTHFLKSLTNDEMDQKEELKEIAEKIKSLTKTLTAKRKDIKENLKITEKKKIFILGQASIYQQQLNGMGLKLKDVAITNILLPEKAGRK
jgi:hypothetical protein